MTQWARQKRDCGTWERGYDLACEASKLACFLWDKFGRDWEGLDLPEDDDDDDSDERSNLFSMTSQRLQVMCQSPEVHHTKWMQKYFKQEKTSQNVPGRDEEHCEERDFERLPPCRQVHHQCPEASE